MTHEEFLQSRRDKNFQGEFTSEENTYWMEMTERKAIEESSGYAQALRQGFPASLAYERIKAGSYRVDQAKEAA